LILVSLSELVKMVMKKRL